MKEDIKEKLISIGFANRYIQLCNDYPDSKSVITVDKKKLEKTLKSSGHKASYEHSQKCFAKTYSGKRYFITFVMSFDEGLFEVFYGIENNSNSEDYIFGRLDALAALENENFESKVTHPIPLPSSTKDLERIVREILKINKDLIKLM